MSTLKVDSILPKTSWTSGELAGTNLDPGAYGKILQTVSVTKTDTYTQSTDYTLIIDDLVVGLTPSSTSSKILILGTINVGGATPTANTDLYLYRKINADWGTGAGATVVAGAIGDASGSEQRSTIHIDPIHTRHCHAASLNYLDSPATTILTTYDIRMRCQNGYTFYINRPSYQDGNTGRVISTITLMEIGP